MCHLNTSQAGIKVHGMQSSLISNNTAIIMLPVLVCGCILRLELHRDISVSSTGLTSH